MKKGILKRIKMNFKHFILIAGIAGILISCRSARPFSRETVSGGLFGDTMVADTATMADTPWQDLFTDPLMKNLIEEGLHNNPDLQIAAQRIIAAEAYFAQGKASLFPTFMAQGGGGYVRNPETLYPDGPREIKDFQLNLQTSWEADIWGKLRSSKRAAYAGMLAGQAGRKAVQTSLIATIANAYYSLLALDEHLSITRETVKNSIDLAETMKALKSSGLVTGAAVVQTEALRYATEVTIPDLEQSIRETENSLCLLLGRTPGRIERNALSVQESPELINTGIPAQLLDNRPDVMQSEYALISAYELTNSARASFYPSLTITALAGFESADLDQLLDPVAFAANVIGGLTAPVFNKRANVTRLKVAKAEQEEARISFRNTLLNAGREVNNALSLHEASRKKILLRQKQLDALQKSVSYTKELLRYGSATYTEVLDAQQNLLLAQIGHVNDHLQKLTSVVSLYRALGGGWK